MSIEINKEITFEFKNKEGKTTSITIDANDLIEMVECSLFDMLEESEVMNCSCVNESQTFCECGPQFEDYEVSDITIEKL